MIDGTVRAFSDIITLMKNLYKKIKNKALLNLVFAVHFLIFLFFPLGFFIPSSVWTQRIEYHFFYTFGLFILFYIWGAIWTFKLKNKLYGFCALDTLMQWLRGYSIWDPKNYEHSFVEEVLERVNIKLPREIITYLILGSVIIATVLYIMKLNGVVLY